MIKVKTFTTEIRIFKTVGELAHLDEIVNRFIEENNIQKVIGISDAATTDNSGATIGLIRSLIYEK
jgi:hypothetical protein